jgi:Ca2+-transporting ATPase
MQRPPRSRREPLYRGLAPFLLYAPLLISAVGLGLFFWIYDPVKDNGIEAQTVAFLVVALSEAYIAFAARSTHYSVFKAGLFANRWLWITVGGSLIVILLLIYIPMPMPFGSGSLQEALHFTPLPFLEFLLVLALSSIGFIYLEVAKTMASRKREKNRANTTQPW